MDEKFEKVIGLEQYDVVVIIDLYIFICLWQWWNLWKEAQWRAVWPVWKTKYTHLYTLLKITLLYNTDTTS